MDQSCRQNPVRIQRLQAMASLLDKRNSVSGAECAEEEVAGEDVGREGGEAEGMLF